MQAPCGWNRSRADLFAILVPFKDLGPDPAIRTPVNKPFFGELMSVGAVVARLGPLAGGQGKET